VIGGQKGGNIHHSTFSINEPNTNDPSLSLYQFRPDTLPVTITDVLALSFPTTLVSVEGP
jgi:hypothetical protein